MSSGLVICSACSREVHQWGDRSQSNGWVHCVDRSPRCFGAHSRYASRDEVFGPACFADDLSTPTPPKPRPIPPHVPGFAPPLEGRQLCQCAKPIRNPHLKPTANGHPRCARCLRAMVGDQLNKATLAGKVPRAHGSSPHRQARVEKFQAAQRRKAEKRKSAKRNRR